MLDLKVLVTTGALASGVPFAFAAALALAPSPMAAAVELARVPSPASADTAEVRLAITGMTCGSCATTARIALERAEGVYEALVSYDSASAVVRYDPQKTSPERFIAQLEKMTGYKARVVEPAGKPKEGP